MNLFERIKKECFWDYDVTTEEIQQYFISGDHKKFLFQKILLNSTHLFEDMEQFEKDDLNEMINEYRVPGFNGEFCARRKNLVEVFFLDKPLTIQELQWLQ